MYKFFYILFFVLFSQVGFSQLDTAYLHAFGNISNDYFESVFPTQDSGYILTGATSSNGLGNTDVYLLKVDSLCNYQWSMSIGESNNDYGTAVIQTHDKGYLIAASTNSTANGGYDAMLIKRDSLGNYQWRKKYGGNDWDFANSVIQTYDSGYVFCGETYNDTQGFSDMYVVKTDTLGDTLWTKKIGGALHDRANVVIEDADSNIVIAGFYTTLNDSVQAYVVKLDRFGTFLWDSLYGGGAYEEIHGMVQASNNDYYFTGVTTSTGDITDEDYYLLRTTKEGTELWSKAHGVTGKEIFYDIIEQTDGNFLNTGVTTAFGAGSDDGSVYVVDGTGNWIKSLTLGITDVDFFKSLAQGINGDYLFAGKTKSFGYGQEDAFMARTDTIRSGLDTLLITFKDMIPVGEEENYNNIELKIYPNPAKKNLTIVSNQLRFMTFTLYNNEGKAVLRRELTDIQNNIKLPLLPPGFYFIKLVDIKTEEIKFSKIIIQ